MLTLSKCAATISIFSTKTNLLTTESQETHEASRGGKRLNKQAVEHTVALAAQPPQGNFTHKFVHFYCAQRYCKAL